jgi:beta-mannosidase
MGAEPDDDLLVGVEWSCVLTSAGTRTTPDDLGAELPWVRARVPGTVADALRDAGVPEPSREHLDGEDWWYRCRFTPPAGSGDPGPWILELDGLATLADVWLNGSRLLHSDSMFASWRLPVGSLHRDGGDNELCIRFAALDPMLAERRPRPRWRSPAVTSQNLRWVRTTLLGRQGGWASIPPPVGPWRPVRLRPVPPVELVSRSVRSVCVDGPDGTTIGTVAVDLVVSGPDLAADGPPVVTVEVAGSVGVLAAEPVGESWRLSGEVSAPGVERWWPHTHGTPTRYPVTVAGAGLHLDLGPVGFRTVVADRDDGGFGLVVNGVPVFCRGAVWYPIDPVSLQAGTEDLLASVELARAAGANMLRIPGGTVYEVEAFFDICDELGILVWQDVMLGPVDPPEDEEFASALAAEVSELLDRAAPHPCLAVLCGGQEVEEVPAMLGLPRERWRSTVLHAVLPELVAREAPGLVYLPTSPGGGDLPFETGTGVTHYFGVGVYLLPLDDLRRAAPRFVAEGLAFSMPAERATVDEQFGDDLTFRREPEWKRGIHRDAGSWFDLEDVRDHYAGALFAEDMSQLRRTDNDRALDLGRAAMAEVVTAAVAEWRRPGSPCAGYLAAAFRDLRAGPGWGLVDSVGRPKSSWYALARGSTPVAVLATDERGDGLALHLVNDTAVAVEATLELCLHTAIHTVERASRPVVVPARGGVEVRANGMLDGFRDITYAYRFGPREYDLVTAELTDPSGRVLSRADYLPGGPARGVDPDIGLQAEVVAADGRVCLLRVSTLRFAQYVQIDVPGYMSQDSWFHLPPDGSRTVRLVPEPGYGAAPRGRVRALNSGTHASVSS